MRHHPLLTPLAWQFYLLALICGLLAPFHALPALSAALLIIIFAKKLHRFSAILMYVAFFAVGAMATLYFSHSNVATDLPDWATKRGNEICGKIVTTTFLPDKRLRLIIDELHSGTDPELPGIPGLCALTVENASLQYPLPGQTVCVKSQLKHANGFANAFTKNEAPFFPETEWRIWSDNQKYPLKITGKPSWLAEARYKVFSKFLRVLNPNSERDETGLKNFSQGQAIITALIFGDRRFLDQKTVKLFANASLAHSLALSGQHLGIAAVFAFFLIIALARFAPSIYLWQPKIFLVALMSIIPAILYLWLGGAPPSLLRAFGMLCFFALLTMARKPATLADLLFLTLAGILLCNPLAIHNTGLQLSALCVAVIFLASTPLFELKHFSGRARFLAPISWISQIFLLSFIIQLALLPLSLASFQQTGVWFALNVLWLPALGFYILPLSALGLLCALPANPILNEIAAQLLKMAEVPCGWLLYFLNYIEKQGAFNLPVFISPHWTIFIAFGLAIIACGIFWHLPPGKRHSRLASKLMAVSICFLAIAPLLRICNDYKRELSVESLDVGQAQALLVNFANNGKIVVDGGGSKSERFDPGQNILTPILTANTTPALSGIISTHPDLDHVGGLFYLIDKFSSSQLFHNGRDANSDLTAKWRNAIAGKNATELACGDRLQLGAPQDNLVLEVLHPPRNEPAWKGNSASLVLRLVKDGKGLALFTGDAEKDTLKLLVKSRQDLTARVLFAPHHGSDRSLYAPFYDAVSPEVVIASCGFENRWNYPGKKLRKFLEARQIPLLDTGTYGRLKADFKDGHLAITAAKPEGRK